MRRLRQPVLLAEAEQGVVDGVGTPQKQHADAAAEVEDAGELVGDRSDQHLCEMAADVRKVRHGHRVLGCNVVRIGTLRCCQSFDQDERDGPRC